MRGREGGLLRRLRFLQRHNPGDAEEDNYSGCCGSVDDSPEKRLMQFEQAFGKSWRELDQEFLRYLRSTR